MSGAPFPREVRIALRIESVEAVFGARDTVVSRRVRVRQLGAVGPAYTGAPAGYMDPMMPLLTLSAAESEGLETGMLVGLTLGALSPEDLAKAQVRAEVPAPLSLDLVTQKKHDREERIEGAREMARAMMEELRRLGKSWW